MAFYTNSSAIGVDLNNSSSTQLFALGAIVQGSDGSIWQYVKAASTISAYAVVVIGVSGTAQMADQRKQADATAAWQFAVAQCTFAPDGYGWVPVHGVGGGNGYFRVKTSGSVSTALSLYLGSGSGNLTISATTSATMAGIAMVTGIDTANTAVTNMPCVISWPKSRTI